MKFADLSLIQKMEVFWHYKWKFIVLKVFDGYSFNSMDFKEFCEHKYHWGTGEADRWLEIFEKEIFK